MKRLLLSALLLINLLGTAAAQDAKPFTGYPSAIWPNSDKPESDQFKLSHDDFTTHYGVTDTATAIIHMYFRKHLAGLRTAQIVGGLTSLSGYIASAQADVEARNQGKQIDPTNRDYPGWVYPVITVGGAGTLWGLVQSLAWSRRGCYVALHRYHTTRQLPRKVRRRLTRFLISTREHQYDDFAH